MSCFVVGCSSGKNGSKAHLFRVAVGVSSSIIQSWKSHIPKKRGIPFVPSKHVVCHRHFLPEHLIKINYIVRDGVQVQSEPKSKWSLTPDAVPTLLLNYRRCSCCGSVVDTEVTPLLHHIVPEQGQSDLISVSSALAKLFELDPVAHLVDGNRRQKEAIFFVDDETEEDELGLCLKCGESLSRVYNCWEEFVHLLQKRSDVVQKLRELQSARGPVQPLLPPEPGVKKKRGRPRKRPRTPSPKQELEEYDFEEIIKMKEEPIEVEEMEYSHYNETLDPSDSLDIKHENNTDLEQEDSQEDQLFLDPIQDDFILGLDGNRIQYQEEEQNETQQDETRLHSGEEQEFKPNLTPEDETMEVGVVEDNHGVSETIKYKYSLHAGPTFSRDSITGEFSCPSCEKTFTNRKSYNRHYTIVHQHFSVKCPLCPKSFTRKDHLLRHQRRFHDQSDDEDYG